MTLDTNDIGALVHIAKRERPTGSTKWDEAGIAHFVRKLHERGFGFGEIHDRVTLHARDRAAKTPAVLLHPITGPAPEPIAPRHPTRTTQCPNCGLRRTACVCDPKVKRKPAVDSRTPAVQTALAEARAALRGGTSD